MQSKKYNNDHNIDWLQSGNWFCAQKYENAELIVKINGCFFLLMMLQFYIRKAKIT